MQHLKPSSCERRRPLNAGCVVDKESLVLVVLGALRFSLVTVVPSLPHSVVRKRTGRPSCQSDTVLGVGEREERNVLLIFVPASERCCVVLCG